MKNKNLALNDVIREAKKNAKYDNLNMHLEKMNPFRYLSDFYPEDIKINAVKEMVRAIRPMYEEFRRYVVSRDNFDLNDLSDNINEAYQKSKEILRPFEERKEEFKESLVKSLYSEMNNYVNKMRKYLMKKEAVIDFFERIYKLFPQEEQIPVKKEHHFMRKLVKVIKYASMVALPLVYLSSKAINLHNAVAQKAYWNGFYAAESDSNNDKIPDHWDVYKAFFKHDSYRNSVGSLPDDIYYLSQIDPNLLFSVNGINLDDNPNDFEEYLVDLDHDNRPDLEIRFFDHNNSIYYEVKNLENNEVKYFWPGINVDNRNLQVIDIVNDEEKFIDDFRCLAHSPIEPPLYDIEYPLVKLEERSFMGIPQQYDDVNSLLNDIDKQQEEARRFNQILVSLGSVSMAAALLGLYYISRDENK